MTEHTSPLPIPAERPPLQPGAGDVAPKLPHRPRNPEPTREPGVRADSELSALLTQLCGERERSGADINTLLARAVWSRLVEPGDAVAGALVGALGPLPALDQLRRPHPARAAEHALRDSGAYADDLPVTRRQLTTAIQRWLPRLDRAATAADLAAAAAGSMRLLTPESAAWPERLNDLGTHAPMALWVRGHAHHLEARSLAVVGARACTGYGSHVTTDLTAQACAAGFTITSGAAYGVDAVAHRTALAVGSPTVAVLAGGADRPYPAAHDQLLTRIAEQGAVCSELVPGAAPTRWRFLQRNRLIAAFSSAVLVTEAGMRSGTINTAGHGAELGRPIGAVPGPVTSAASAGCHRLVREYDAALITNGGELLDLLGVSADAQLSDSTASSAGGGSEGAMRPPSRHIRMLDALPLSGARTVSDAALRAGVTREEARDILAELEVLGYATPDAAASDAEAAWRLNRRV